MEKKIIVIGAFEHGKTTLIAAIKSVFGGEFTHPMDIEKIDSRYSVKLNYGGEEFEFFDFPSTEDYEENIDGTETGALLVIDSCEGPLGEARKHIGICIENGIQNFAIFMNKKDLVDDDDLMEICEYETREVFDEEGIFGDDVPAVWGSAEKALWNPESMCGDCIREIVYKISIEF